MEYSSWYLMPISVHKILCHGRDIIASCILPFGPLSEEHDTKNKQNRKYRELFTRKKSRIDINTDLFLRLLIMSNPLITSLRDFPKPKQGKITPELFNLLKEQFYEYDTLNAIRNQEYYLSDTSEGTSTNYLSSSDS